MGWKKDFEHHNDLISIHRAKQEDNKNGDLAVSKGFSMTGWRLGYMAAPLWVAKACSKMQGQFTSGANSYGQKAASEALLSDMTPTTEMNAAFRKRRDLVLKLLKGIKEFKVNYPEGAFYVFPDISSIYGRSFGDRTINNSSDFG